jgi:hypothetical protein
MTRPTPATRRDEHATSLVAPSSRARRAPQPPDQPQHPKHPARDERDEEITPLTNDPPKPPIVADDVDALLARTVLAHGLSIPLQDPIVLERVADIVRSARQTQRHARAAEPAA